MRSLSNEIRCVAAAGLGLSLLFSTTLISMAQSPLQNIPTPPPRPANLKPALTSPEQPVETKVTHTPQTKPSAELIIPTLPTATRARMQECGLEWNEMKKKGSAAEKTWRDFAMKCLAR